MRPLWLKLRPLGLNLGPLGLNLGPLWLNRSRLPLLRSLWPLWLLLWYKLKLVESWVGALQLVGEGDSALVGGVGGGGGHPALPGVPQHLEAQLAGLLHALVLQELVEVAHSQLLAVLQEAECPGVG